jgi:hypothetical protein
VSKYDEIVEQRLAGERLEVLSSRYDLRIERILQIIAKHGHVERVAGMISEDA